MEFNTVSVTVDFQQSRPCWIQLCCQCVLGFRLLWEPSLVEFLHRYHEHWQQPSIPAVSPQPQCYHEQRPSATVFCKHNIQQTNNNAIKVQLSTSQSNQTTKRAKNCKFSLASMTITIISIPKHYSKQLVLTVKINMKTGTCIVISMVTNVNS